MATAPQLGEMAPGFSLPSDGGQTISLSDLRGRKVVLYFYPKDDTSGCSVQAKEFNDRLDAFADAGTVVIGVSPDGVASHDRFKKKLNLGFRLAADEGREVLEAYGVWAEKSMYGRKYMGVERTTYLLDEKGTVIGCWRKVKPAGHADEVLQAVREPTRPSQA